MKPVEFDDAETEAIVDAELEAQGLPLVDDDPVRLAKLARLVVEPKADRQVAS